MLCECHVNVIQFVMAKEKVTAEQENEKNNKVNNE